ncbi:MAG TPA: DoxX family protein [Gemmatimonadaceae bacterium]|nr:DoxX family protein [Gemmatimonadaceae bacterium]
MPTDLDQRLRVTAQTALRIAAGLAYFSHATQKLFGWFGGFGPQHGPAELMSRFGLAGVLETVFAICLILGLFTRAAAFLASGEMAVTYFWMHWGQSGQMWWWQNRGELPLLFAFIWFLYFAWGAGPISLDAWLRRRRAGAT